VSERGDTRRTFGSTIPDKSALTATKRAEGKTGAVPTV